MMEKNINVFSLVTFPRIFQEPRLTKFFSDIHRYSTIALFSLVVLHIFAVLKHEIGGKRILKRML